MASPSLPLATTFGGKHRVRLSFVRDSAMPGDHVPRSCSGWSTHRQLSFILKCDIRFRWARFEAPGGSAESYVVGDRSRLPRVYVPKYALWPCRRGMVITVGVPIENRALEVYKF